MLAVLAGIDLLGEHTTLVDLARFRGLDKKTVGQLVAKAIDQARVAVSKVRPMYWIEDWGLVVKRQGARQILQGWVGRFATTDRWWAILESGLNA